MRSEGFLTGWGSGKRKSGIGGGRRGSSGYVDEMSQVWLLPQAA
jgi:hypothetical protein